MFENSIISVIVPNHNNGKWISDCFDSILNQSYKYLEIVVIDDASTDESHDIIRQYQNKYPDIFSLIFFDENRGVAKARHAGILQSKGKYITTLDADDYYDDKRKLEKEIELIKEYKEKYNKNIIAFSNFIIEKKDSTRIIKGNDKNIVQGNILNHIITRNCMIPRDLTFLTSIYFNVSPYDSSVEPHEDWDLKIRLAEKHEYYYTGINGTVYRRHDTGLSSRPHAWRTRTLNRVFKKNIHLIKNNAEKLKVKNSFKSFMLKRDIHYLKQLKIFDEKTSVQNKLRFLKKFSMYYNIFRSFGFRGIYFLLKDSNQSL